MTHVDQATRIVLDHASPLAAERVPLSQAMGRVLQQDIVADRDFPPFDRVAMDGIAIRFADFAAGQRSFAIAGTGAAGAPQMQLAQAGSCLEIMTGAMLPAGADTVIRYEDVSIQAGVAQLNIQDINQGQNVHHQGIDRHAGEVIVAAGKLISAAEIGVAATVGCSSLLVKALPAVLVVSTGDELVPVDAQPLAHQIRASNVHQLSAMLQAWGMSVSQLHLPDEAATIRQALHEALSRYPVVVLSGGVSAGKFDYLPDVLSELGVEKQFHQVIQRPGKPFWFGVHPGGTRVFALPGNPVSSFMCALRYIRPWLNASLGLPPLSDQFAQLSHDIPFKPKLAYFAAVKLHSSPSGQWLAEPILGHGSGDLANLVDAQAFIELPEGKDVYQAGEQYRVWPW